ncbi:conserved hypothetical protein [Paraburkholderia caribensis]|nr:conserved hypothetical protein [Paraburkholderia caribensis]
MPYRLHFNGVQIIAPFATFAGANLTTQMKLSFEQMEIGVGTTSASGARCDANQFELGCR